MLGTSINNDYATNLSINWDDWVIHTLDQAVDIHYEKQEAHPREHIKTKGAYRLHNTYAGQCLSLTGIQNNSSRDKLPVSWNHWHTGFPRKNCVQRKSALIFISFPFISANLKCCNLEISRLVSWLIFGK